MKEAHERYTWKIKDAIAVEVEDHFHAGCKFSGISPSREVPSNRGMGNSTRQVLNISRKDTRGSPNLYY